MRKKNKDKRKKRWHILLIRSTCREVGGLKKKKRSYISVQALLQGVDSLTTLRAFISYRQPCADLIFGVKTNCFFYLDIQNPPSQNFNFHRFLIDLYKKKKLRAKLILSSMPWRVMERFIFFSNFYIVLIYFPSREYPWSTPERVFQHGDAQIKFLSILDPLWDPSWSVFPCV